jgi:predicted Zn-dependent protease
LWAALGACAKAPEPEPRPSSQRAADWDAAWDRLALGDAEEALQMFQALSAEEPLDALAHLGRGEALFRLGRVPEASVAARQALAADASVPQGARLLAAVTAALGRTDEAVGWLAAALSLGQIEADEVFEDEDFAELKRDHRVAFFGLTGFLPSRD